MFDAVFIGDEATAAGWRLAGLRVVVAGPDEAGAELAAAREHAALVLIGAASAGGIDEAELAAAARFGRPPVVVVPDARGYRPPDPADTINRVFGLEQ
ncbi:MAG: V-type ATP synthase subunit F [Gammaproteobacteria bacterium]|jgi:vacuolar-type H+-ATPase subunit F/Vma7